MAFVFTTPITADTTLYAKWTTNNYTLSLTKTGTGSGTVAANSVTLDSSTANYAYGTIVTLTATANSGFTFIGWSGACSGTGACLVTMDVDKSVTATFADITPPTITISSQPLAYSNQGSGTITFNANETATFECKLDSGVYAACTSPFNYSNLANGQHTFVVRATDSSSNVSTPVSFTWTVITALASSAIVLPQTGQTTCYDTAGAIIACADTGQDGALQAGVAWPTPRFVDNSVASSADQTGTDKLTGLIWTKDANSAAGTKTWQEALDYIKTLNSQNYQGHNDWRLPNRIELQSLVNRQQSNLRTRLN